MDGWSPIVATASDNDRSSSEGEYMVEPGPKDVTRDEEVGNVNPERADPGGAAAVGFGIDLLREEEEIAAQVRKSSKKRPKVGYLSIL